MLFFYLLSTGAFADSFIWLEGEDATSHDFLHHSWYGNGVNKHLLSPGLPESIDGDWLVNYNWSDPGPKSASWTIQPEEEGEYALWLRVATPYTKAWVAIDGSDPLDLDIDSNIRERINLVQPTLDHRSLGWVYGGSWDLNLDLHTLTYGLEPHEYWGGELNCGGIDAMVLVNFDWAPSGSEPPDLSGREHAPDEWFSFHPNDPPSDWSDSVAAFPVDAPAGNRGRIHRDGSGFVDEAGESIKLWGINASMPATAELMEQQAEMYANLGINLVRHHTVLGMISGPDGIDPDKMDRYDQWFSLLKNAGVYVQWSIFYPLVIQESDGYPLFDDLNGGSTSGLVTVFPALQDLEWAVLEPLLNHTNPYTGLSYTDDPALAVLEIRNEDSIFFHNPLNPLADGTYSAHAAALQGDWADWLAENYEDDTALATAWGDGMRAGDSLENPSMSIYGAWEMAADGPTMNPIEVERMGDWIAFLAERQRDGYERRIERARSVGFDGVMVSTAWWAGGPAAALANLWTDDAADAIDRHGYYGGGTEMEPWHQLFVGPVSTGSMLTEPGQGVFHKAALQVAGKPMMMSEWTSSPPNRQKLEAVPMFGFYGMGLYGWDASTHFQGGHAWFDGGWPGWGIWGGQTPHHLGQFFAVSRAIHEGHIQEGDPAAVLHFTEDEIATGVDARPTVDPWLAAIGPQTVSFSPGTSEVESVDDYRDGNFIESTTGELSWNTDGYFLIETDRTQGVVGAAGGLTHNLPDVTVELTTEFVSLLFTSLDGLPLGDSGSILITAIARDQQTGSLYSDDGSELLALGGPPLMIEPVQAQLTFSGEAITSVKTLNEYGVPTGTVSDIDGNSVTLDGRWATAWYQVVRPANQDTGSPDEDPPDAGVGDDVSLDADLTPPDKGGCGCSASAFGPGSIPWLLGLLVVARRRAEDRPFSEPSH